MLRIFLILSLAVALAGLVFSFVLNDKVRALSDERTAFREARDTAQNEATQAKAAEKKARDAEKSLRDELDGVKQELATASASLNQTSEQLARTAKELEETKIVRDTSQRNLARWEATGVTVDQINAVKADARRFKEERDAFSEEKKVMSREIVRLNSELDVYRGANREVMMPDVRGRITAVDGNFKFVILDIGSEDGLKPNGKLIVTRGDNLLAKIQLVRVDSRSAVGNLLPDWAKGEIQTGDQVMTSYEALAK